MAVIALTASYTMALPIVCPVLALRMLSAMTAYMLSLAALSAAPRSPSILSSLICDHHRHLMSFLTKLTDVLIKAKQCFPDVRHRLCGLQGCCQVNVLQKTPVLW